MAAAGLSFKAVALAALLSVLAAYGARAQQQQQPSNATESQDRSLLSYSGGWLPARATWYGAPTGAGPDDNGMDQYLPLRAPVSLSSAFVVAHIRCSGQCGSSCAVSWF
jgi:hypothetical protein